MTDLVQRTPNQLGVRAMPALRLSIGYRDTTKRGSPVRTDYFIPQEGVDGECAAAAKRFRDYHRERERQALLERGVSEAQVAEKLAPWDARVEAAMNPTYAAGPRSIDIRLPAHPAEAFSIMYRAWGGDGGDEGGVLKAIGHTNFAFAGTEGGPDTLTVWEPDGTVATIEISGLDDPRAVELGLELSAELTFYMPEVLGLTGAVAISTKARKSMHNLWSNWRQLYGWFGPLVPELVRPKLVLRKAHSRPVVDITDRETRQKVRRRIKSTFYALDLYVPDTEDEIKQRLAGRSELLPAPGQDVLQLGAGAPSWEVGVRQGQIAHEMAQLPPAPEEPVAVREDPGERAADSVLNRIAHLTERVGDAAALTTLRGVFGKDSPEELAPADAERYAQYLERALPDEPEPEADSAPEVEEVAEADYEELPAEEEQEEESPYQAAARRAQGQG